MSQGLSFSPPRLTDANDSSRIRAALEQADFTHSNILKALATKDLKLPRPSDLPILLRRTGSGSPLDTLIRLFVLGVPVEKEAASQALATMPLERWAEIGFVAEQKGRILPQLKLVPFKERMFAFDLPRGHADFVMGVAGSSVTLANLTIRHPVRTALDLGSGCGIQACLAAAHSERVWAVDRSPRAIDFTTFNARLNGLDNVECGAGDRFAPVAGRKFDLIVSNPPFVISPGARYVFRDSGLHGDQFCQQLVRTAPEFLEEGGFCQMLCNWAHVGDQDWRERLEKWFAGNGCDVWVLRSETDDPSGYAATWIQSSGEQDPEAVGQEYDEWMAYYRQEGITAISFGSVTMRRSSGRPNWFRAEDAPERMLGPCGDGIARGFLLRDFVTATGDQALLDAALSVSPDARLEQRAEPGPRGWQPSASRLCLDRGLAYSGPTDPMSAALLGGCNGKRKLRELVGEIATSLETDVPSIAPACLEVVRRLIERGFVLPPGVEC